ncbi:hypothetical protein DID80_08530 [Candidatus Marinamargulisbacteria bacterium SCGC AAA071-K20]|nr:hypothetical protein DID80_08530 [Candidatus Marinamargulisbacteria bacterium SCGC AAA071-K20]
MWSTHKEMFLKGKSSENLGLGIGAYGYYRRVVENQKDTLLNKIINVLEKSKNTDKEVKVVKKAIKEKQFSKAIKNVKDVIPESLYINGHNPFILLHKALSDGLHSQTDEACLEYASNIRTVLVAFSERLSLALKNETELSKAISNLTNKKFTKAD